MPTIDPEHHARASDATPGGATERRRPGELAFAAAMLAASLGLLWSAYGISGFEALSAPGAAPMATTFVMVVAAAITLAKTLRLPLDRAETAAPEILPSRVLIVGALLVGYALLLEPLGFLPTSALFLIAAIRLLGRRGWASTLLTALGSLAAIWLIFRIVFSVLMPAGIVPEAEFIQLFRDLLSGGDA